MQAYDKLLFKDAAQMLRFDVQQDMAAFCKQQGWRTDSQYVYFAAPPVRTTVLRQCLSAHACAQLRNPLLL